MFYFIHWSFKRVGWHAACRQVGAVFTTVIAEDVLRDWDLNALVAAGVLKII